MKKYLKASFLVAVLLVLGACVSKQKSKQVTNTQTVPHDNSISKDDPKAWEPIVAIFTTEGEIRVKLYNETPIHQKNFLKLVEDGFYDSLLFHRVIQNFMIQGGDPDSKKAKDNQLLGDGDVGYTVPSEFNQKLFHKRGALAAARESDLINPDRASSGCQFYIVQGKIYNDSTLKLQAKRITKYQVYNKVINLPANKSLLNNYKKHLNKNPDSVLFYSAKIDKQVEMELDKSKPYEFTPEQIKAYKTTGGSPHLDGSYTVFGEVIQGMDIVDKIASAPRDSNDRPITNIRILKMIELKRI